MEIFRGIFPLVLIHQYLCVEVRVNTGVGEIIGTATSIDFRGTSRSLKQYLGIPYAKPPVGDLRFRKPVRLEKLPQSPFSASQYGFICPQIISPGEPFVGIQDEDCLHLNVFVPDEAPDETSGHAVMIWIHGGAFILDSSDQYDAKTLSTFGNVIVVTINYRLGPLGFISTMDSNCPGNFGLWDQQVAIIWVRDNIAAFGGDVNRITVFGESAGAISATLQGMRPENNGVFQRILAQSGSPSVRSMNCSRDTLKQIRFIAGQLGCTSSDTAVMIECLRKISWQDYMAFVNSLNEGFTNIEYVIFDPVVDGDFIPFEPRGVYQMVKRHPVEEVEMLKSFDMLSGMNAYEGAYYIQFFANTDNVHTYQPTTRDMREEMIPAAMQLVYNRTFPDSILDIIHHEYTNWSYPYDYTTIRLELARIFGDTGFAVPTVEYNRLQLSDPPIKHSYMYKFMPLPSVLSPATPLWTPGANHGDDLGFVFGFQDNPAEPWELELSAQMMRYWTNFAKTADPNLPSRDGPEWPKYDMTSQYYMALDRDSSSVQQFLYAKEYNFWLEVLPQLVAAADNGENHRGFCVTDTASTADGGRIYLVMAVLVVVAIEFL